MTYAHPRHPVHLLPVLASNTAFAVIFGIFIVALVVLIVIVGPGASRRARAGRGAGSRRQQNKVVSGEGDVPPKAPS